MRDTGIIIYFNLICNTLRIIIYKTCILCKFFSVRMNLLSLKGGIMYIMIFSDHVIVGGLIYCLFNNNNKRTLKLV